jgi:hypothetical protein
MRKVFIITLLIIAISSWAAYELSARDEDTKSFIASGTKEINPKDRAASRSEALTDCLIDAVRQYVSTKVPPKVFEISGAILKKKIYDNYSQFLANYRIREEKEEAGFYKLTAEVRLNSDFLDQKLAEIGLGGESQPKPSLIVLITDVQFSGPTQSARSEYTWWVKDAISDSAKQEVHPLQDKIEGRLISLGFPVLEKATLLSRIADARVSLQRNLIKGDIEALSSLNLGDILVIGSANALLRTKDRKISISKINFNISSVNLRDGSRFSSLQRTYEVDSIIEKAKASGKTLDPSEAVMLAVDEFSYDLVESFIAKWTRSSANIKTLDLNVTGIYSWPVYSEIKKIVSEMKPVVVNIEDSVMQKGSYRWKIEINGQPETVARKLNKRKVADSVIEVTSVSTDNITLTLK